MKLITLIIALFLSACSTPYVSGPSNGQTVPGEKDTAINEQKPVE